MQLCCVFLIRLLPTFSYIFCRVYLRPEYISTPNWSVRGPIPMKILIVDDEETITSYFSQLAEINGFDQIDCVNSGEEAMTQVLRSVYDVITLDIQMPGASGLEIIAMLRNMCPHAIIAVVSGFLPETMSEDISSCIDVLISKPVNVDTFSTLLQKAQQIQSAMNDIRALGIAPDSLN